MIGDRWKDIEAGQSAGCKTIFIDYNYKEIKKELSDLGHRFYSETDTEVILCAFKEWGARSLHKFNGMWSFAILDTIKKNLIILITYIFFIYYKLFKNDNIIADNIVG